MLVDWLICHEDKQKEATIRREGSERDQDDGKEKKRQTMGHVPCTLTGVNTIDTQRRILFF
jgi:hypothetical protein